MSVGPLTFIICLVVAIFAARRWSARPSIETASPWRGLLVISLCAALAAVLVLALSGHSRSRHASSDRAVAREEVARSIRSAFGKRGEIDQARRALREGIGETRRAFREGIGEASRALRDLAHTSVPPLEAPVPVPGEALDPMERLSVPQAHVSIDLNGKRAVVAEARPGRARADRRSRRGRNRARVVTLNSAGSHRLLLHPLASAVIMVAMLAAAAWVLRMSVRRLPRRG